MSFEPDWINISLGAFVILIPLYIFFRIKLGLIKDLIISFARMLVQLVLAGFYLKYIIDLNNLYFNLGFLVIMILAGAWTVSSRTGVYTKFLIKPVFWGFFTGVVTVNLFVGLLFFRGGDYLNAQFIIPISGMLIGNSLSSAVISIRSFFKQLINNEHLNYYRMVHGADLKATTQNILREAFMDGFKPALANISAIGLIWIPGTMTGQIITGASPITAIKYQIIIVFGYFACCVLSTYISLLYSRKHSFDELGVLQVKMKD